MGRSRGLEPPTLGTTNRCSNQLSYDRHRNASGTALCCGFLQRRRHLGWAAFERKRAKPRSTKRSSCPISRDLARAFKPEWRAIFELQIGARVQPQTLQRHRCKAAYHVGDTDRIASPLKRGFNIYPIVTCAVRYAGASSGGESTHGESAHEVAHRKCVSARDLGLGGA